VFNGDTTYITQL